LGKSCLLPRWQKKFERQGTKSAKCDFPAREAARRAALWFVYFLSINRLSNGFCNVNLCDFIGLRASTLFLQNPFFVRPIAHPVGIHISSGVSP
jgi:hypothetical protein